MATIQLEMPVELAQRLQGYPDTPAQIIEWGLCVAENKERHAASPVMEAEAQEHSKVMEALCSTGLVVRLAARYQVKARGLRRTPINVGGRPLSEIIVAERGPEWSEKQ